MYLEKNKTTYTLEWMEYMSLDNALFVWRV
jgi:hypothetical protein